MQGTTPARLSVDAGVPLSCARRILASLFRDEPPDAPLDQVRRASRERVAALYDRPSLELIREDESQVDPFRKLVLRLGDGELIEAVRIPLHKAGRYSACVSSQAGCALACAFCATGRLGLRRNLQTWEIVEQVRLVRRTLELAAGERVHGVVFQGMGEPMSNLDRVLEAISVLSDPSGLAIDRKAITVCTAGVPSGIRRLAREAPKVRLGLSIGSARQEVRARLMPIARAHPLDEVIDAAIEHARATGSAPLFAVTPLDGENDADEDARALAALVARFRADAGVSPRLSVIPYNRIAGDADDPFRRQGEARAARFLDVLRDGGVHPHLRYSGGGDVAAACGQLAARAATPS
ncbi:MAG: radical SAM protein [Polyangiaceae bacterium]|nr:radical SAM protein [Polyangiaceae bacterium]